MADYVAMEVDSALPVVGQPGRPPIEWPTLKQRKLVWLYLCTGKGRLRTKAIPARLREGKFKPR